MVDSRCCYGYDSQLWRYRCVTIPRTLVVATFGLLRWWLIAGYLRCYALDPTRLVGRGDVPVTAEFTRMPSPQCVLPGGA